MKLNVPIDGDGMTLLTYLQNNGIDANLSQWKWPSVLSTNDNVISLGIGFSAEVVVLVESEKGIGLWEDVNVYQEINYRQPDHLFHDKESCLSYLLLRQ